jgi:hypothetical protein
MEMNAFQLSRIYAQGWNAAKKLLADGNSGTDESQSRTLNPYRSTQEAARWTAGFEESLRSLTGHSARRETSWRRAPAGHDDIHRTAPSTFMEGDDKTAEGPEPLWPKPALEKAARRASGRKVVTTATLTSRTCKWPIGDPVETGFHYCGKMPRVGSPYCVAHDQMSYQPVRLRKS